MTTKGKAKAAPTGTSGVGIGDDGQGLTARQLAENYGFAWAFLRHHNDVWNTFQTAITKGYSVDRFKAALQGTNWWKQTTANVRAYQLGVASDPTTWASKQAALSANIAAKAGKMGAIVSNKTLQNLSKTALMLGWNDAQVQAHLATYVRAVHGVYQGDAASNIDALRQMAWKNGLRVSSTALGGWAKNIASGKQTIDYYRQYTRQQAKALAPSFSKELDAGMDLSDIADPYIQHKADILQVDPASIDLYDNDIRQALSAKDAKGNPTSMSLWEFEQNMRNKPEYLKTDAARDGAYSIAHKVLNDFGFTGA